MCAAGENDPSRGPITLFIPNLSGGGAERVVQKMANELAKRKHDVHVVLNHMDGPYIPALRENIGLFCLGTRKFLASVFALAEYLGKERPSALISFMHFANVVAISASRLSFSRARVIVTEHSQKSYDVGHLRPVSRSLILLYMRLAYNLSDEVVCVSSGTADELSSLLGMPRDRITVIYNPLVDEELFQKARAHIEDDWIRDGSTPTILGVGRLTKQKSFITLIRAVSHLRRQGQSAKLALIGEGESRAELEAEVRRLGMYGHVRFLGFQQNPYAFMARAALVVLTSEWEGFGNVLVEAMALGTPVLSTDTSGPREILEGGRLGALVPVGDVAAIAKAISSALAKPTARPILIEAAARFRVEPNVDEYLKLMFPDG